MTKQALRTCLPFILTILLTACGGGDDDGGEPTAFNQPPAVNAGLDQSVYAGETVTLSGTASDSDGYVASHRWEQTGGVSAPLSSVAGAIATFTAPEVSADETLMFRLTVTDDDGARASDEVRVTVRQVESNQPPAVNAGPDLFVDEGAVVTMSGTASDSDGYVASHRWEQTGGVSAPLSSVAGATATFTAPDVSADATLTFRLTVTDDDGARASDEVRVTVRRVNQPPAVNAGLDQSVYAGEIVTLSGAASDADGSIVSYQWAQTGGTTVSLSGANSAMATFTAADETLTFRLAVADDDGAQASDAVRVVVTRGVSVTVPDASLRTALEEHLRKTPGAPIYTHEMATLEVLYAPQQGIRNLEGLQFATNLTYLDPSGVLVSFPLEGGQTGITVSGVCAISELSPLSGLTELETLILGNCAISDLSSLSGLTKLETLFLIHNSISDLSPLAGLTNLRHLYLDGSNGISDISPLAGLINLRSLTLLSGMGGKINISDISPLAGLTNLEFLTLGGGYDVPDLSPLSGMTKMQRLLIPEANISDLSPLAGMTDMLILGLSRNNISDLSPLAGMTELDELSLLGNNVSDLSLVAAMTQLRFLTMDGNQISDLAPLVANTGLGQGDEVLVRINPLDAASLSTHIPALQARGVKVLFDEVLVTVDGEPQIYNDNVFVLPVAENLATDPLPLEDYTTRFYEYFDDAFDFLMIVSNLVLGEDEQRGYAGAYFGVMNDVEGIGKPLYSDDSWGSAGKLQSVLHFTSFWALGGPTLHELMHRWANFIVTSYEPHWGFSSANGQLGGFDIANLVDHGGGRYTAGEFSLGGYAGNIKPYSPIELYLAGFIPPEEVPDLWVAEDGEHLLDENGNNVRADNGYPIFTASRIRRYTIEDIIAEHGPRIPDASQAQRDFRAAVILLIDENHPASKRVLEGVSDFVSRFSYAGEDEYDETYNFYEATGGRGTITMDGLSQF